MINWCYAIFFFVISSDTSLHCFSVTNASALDAIFCSCATNAHKQVMVEAAARLSTHITMDYIRGITYEPIQSTPFFCSDTSAVIFCGDTSVLRHNVRNIGATPLFLQRYIGALTRHKNHRCSSAFLLRYIDAVPQCAHHRRYVIFLQRYIGALTRSLQNICAPSFFFLTKHVFGRPIIFLHLHGCTDPMYRTWAHRHIFPRIHECTDPMYMATSHDLVEQC